MIRWIGFFAVLVSLAPSLHAQQARPNIVFLFSDDHNADAIGALGNSHIKTPHLDSLYARGFHFRSAFCMGGLQGAVCVPSRAMLMSGRSLFRVDERLAKHELMPAALAKAGYVTYGAGKWHNGQPSFARAFQHGKSIFFGGMSNQSAVAIADLKPGGGFTPKRKGDGFSSGIFADAAVDFITAHKADKPFLLYVAFTQPHDPRTSPPPYASMYDPAKLPLPQAYLPVHPFRNGEMTVRDEKLLPWPRTEEAVRREIADYYGSITYMDAQIGRILWALKQAGQLENTLIVFAGDHGLAMGRHGLLGKQNLYDHSMRAPLVIAGPGVKKGGSDALCYLHDIFPTLFELAGVPQIEGIDGRSLASVLAGREAKHREALLLAYRDVQRALRTERWKLIVYPKINRVQLFDVQEDPHELRDLSQDQAQADRVKQMLGMLAAAQSQAGDKAPLQSEKPEPQAFTPPVP